MRQRTSYPKPFKAQVVQECLQPGVSMASVALRHGINANAIADKLVANAQELLDSRANKH